MVETITYEMEIMFGILLVGRFSYKLSEEEDALNKLLGDSASEIMMVHLRVPREKVRFYAKHLFLSHEMPARQHLKSGKNQSYARIWLPGKTLRARSVC